MMRDLTRALVCFAAVITSSALAATGRTPGNASISPSGAANYTIPLWTPPGIRGLAPSLALVYSSRSGDGLAGVGFDVAFGQSMISRCDKTIAQDGSAHAANLSSFDRFCLDGNQLRLTGGTYGAANSTYQTEVETFSRIIAKGTAGDGPQWFEAWGKNGLVYEYGKTTDSRIESNLTAGGQTTTVRAWAISKVRDRTGNEINFKYIDDTTNGSFRPDEIAWAGNTNTALADRYRIKFVYETPDRPDPIYSYMFGNATGIDGHINEFKRLDRIDVLRISPALLVRRYDLIYDPGGGISGPSRLQSLKECGGSSGTDCLSQTDFDWQNGTPGINTTVLNSGQTVPVSATSLVMDINGDGRDDLVWSSSATSGSGTWRYMLANASGGFGAMVNTGITNTNESAALPIQWNGDDKWDILVPYSGNKWHVLVANGSGFNTPVNTNVLSTSGNYWVADIDGDGRGDLIRATNVGGYGMVYVRLRSGSAFAAETLAIDMTTWPSAGTVFEYTVWGSNPLGRVSDNSASSHKHPDFNGDSREDFILSVNRRNIELGTNTRMLYIILGGGSGLTKADTFVGLTSLYYWRYGDFNGDGKTDIGYKDGGSFHYAFSRGTSLFADTFAVTYISHPHVVMDYDGDGKDDLVAAKSGSSNWWYSRSTGWSLDTLADSGTAVSNADLTTSFVGDLDGDGLHDLSYRQSTDQVWKAKKHKGVAADLLLTATDGFGVEAGFEYSTIAKLTTEGGCYTRDAGAPAFPVRAFRGDLIVACSLEASNGIGGTYTQSFTFYNANLHLQGRGFLGFSKVRSSDSRNNLIQQATFSQTFPYVGMPLSQILYQPNGSTKIAQTSNTLQKLDFGTGFNTRSFPYVSNATSDAWEVGGPRDGDLTVRKVTAVSSIDSYGNPTTVTQTTTDQDTLSPWYLESHQVETVSSITNSTTNWCLGLPSETGVTSTLPDGTSQTRTVDYGTPDYFYCRQTQEIIEPTSTTLKVTSTYGFDSCGNVNSVTVVGKNPNGTNMPSRVTQSGFGTTCQFPVSVTNALGQTSSAVFWSHTGLPFTRTDANGLTVSFNYDNFGRPKSMTRPDGTATRTTYSLCTGGCDSRVKMVATVEELDTTTAVVRSSKQYFDMLDRPIYSYGDALGGSETVTTSYFDALGRLEKQYEPVFAGNPWGAYTQRVHDLANRVTRAQLRTGSGVLDRETVISYEGRKVVTMDPKGAATQRFVDVRGSLRRLTDPAPGGTTNYAFDHFGNLKSVTDAAGNVTSAGYDLRGFRTSTSDPDLGNWTYAFTSLGELVSQTDAKSQVTTVVYDKLSRPTSRTETEGTSTWVWGTSAAQKEIGKLESLSGPGGYSEAYLYDSLGRPSSTTITADTTYSINMGYESATGLPESLTYPVSTSGYRLKTRFEYDHGILSKISDFNAPGTVFWQLNAHDERGQPIDEALGNGARIVSGFDPLTGLMEYRQTGTVAPWTNRQDLAFEWDLNGNLKKRIDLNQSNLTEEFFYDALNRLDYSQRNGVTNLDLTLDAIGNITAKTSATDPAENVGSYTYHATKKHAVVSTSNGWSFGYDANGNMNAYKGNAISWTSYNLPNTINAAGESSQFFYGPNRNRWKQVATYASGNETTIYVGGILEKLIVPTGTAYRHFIGAGSAKVIYTRWASGSITTKYVTSDHLNSSTVVMDHTGAALVNLSFASFGARRDDDWSGPVGSGDMTQISNATRRGFTGHEHLDNLAIVHMNGRVFDPALGRFLSADPFIDGIASSQGSNRFAYVHNSPLSFIDPTGWAHQGMTLVLPKMPNELPQLETIQVNNTGIGGFDVQRDQVNQTQIWIAGFRQFANVPDAIASDGSIERTDISDDGEITVTAERIDSTPTFNAGAIALGGNGIESSESRTTSKCSGRNVSSVSDRLSEGPDFVSIAIPLPIFPLLGMTHTTDRYGNSYIGAGAGFGYPAVGLTAGYVMQPGDTVFSNTYIPSAAEMRDFLTGLSAWFGAVGGIAVNGPNDVNRNRTAITLTTPSFGANYAWESSFEVLSSCPSQGS
jgi:RHS repeat-associated protein